MSLSTQCQSFRRQLVPDVILEDITNVGHRFAADAPCGRLMFSKCQLRRTGARLSGRAHRPDDDAVPPMEDIEDDRSEVLAAAEVHRGGLQPLAHAASKPVGRTGGFVPERLYLC